MCFLMKCEKLENFARPFHFCVIALAVLFCCHGNRTAGSQPIRNLSATIIAQWNGGASYSELLMTGLFCWNLRVNMYCGFFCGMLYVQHSLVAAFYRMLSCMIVYIVRCIVIHHILYFIEAVWQLQPIKKYRQCNNIVSYEFLSIHRTCDWI